MTRDELVARLEAELLRPAPAPMAADDPAWLRFRAIRNVRGVERARTLRDLELELLRDAELEAFAERRPALRLVDGGRASA